MPRFTKNRAWLVSYLQQIARKRGSTPTPTPVPTPSPPLTFANLPSDWLYDRFGLDAGLSPTGGPYSSWASVKGQAPALVQATAINQPTLGTNGGVKMDGSTNSGQGDFLAAASNPNFGDGLVIVNAIRGNLDGPAAAPTNRTIFGYGRPADNLTLKILTVRVASEPAQNTVKIQRPGTSTGAINLTGGWLVGQKSAITMMVKGDRIAGFLNGQVMSAFTSTVGVNTTAAMQLAGDPLQTADKKELEVFNILFVPSTQIQEMGYISSITGNPRNQWHPFVLEALLGWNENPATPGVTFVDRDLWPETHPFKTTAPKLSDLDVMGVHQGWANSLGVGMYPKLRELWNPKGVVAVDASAGGATSTTIKQLMVDGFNTGTGTNDNAITGDATKAVQRKRPQTIGPMWANGPTDTSGTDADRTARMLADVAEMVAMAETAQAPSPRKIVVIAPELTGSMTTGSAGRILRDARVAQVFALYPDEAFDYYEQMLADALPDGLNPDPTNAALGKIPAVYYSEPGVDELHLSTAGYVRAAFLIAQEHARRGFGPAV